MHQVQQRFQNLTDHAAPGPVIDSEMGMGHKYTSAGCDGGDWWSSLALWPWGSRSNWVSSLHSTLVSLSKCSSRWLCSSSLVEPHCSLLGQGIFWNLQEAMCSYIKVSACSAILVSNALYRLWGTPCESMHYMQMHTLIGNCPNPWI